MKPMLQAPGSKRLKLQYDNQRSSFSFKFKLRRYSEGLAVLTPSFLVTFEQGQLPPIFADEALSGRAWQT